MDNKSIKILELIYGFRVGGKGGGIERFGIELCRNLNHQNFDVYLCGLFNKGSPLENKWLEQLNHENIRSFHASNWQDNHPYLSFINSVRFLWDWQYQNKANIIHSHSEFTDIAAIILKFHPTKPKIIRTVHYGFKHEWRKRPLRRLLLTNFLFPLLFDSEIGVSQSISSNLNRRIIAKFLKIKSPCIYNAIDLQRFQQTRIDRIEKRISLNIPIDAPLIGTVGRLTEQKGYNYFIDAASLVLKNIPQAYFIIIGDGELADQLKIQAQNLGIYNKIIFTGSRSDIDEILPCLDLFVSSSLWEGFPTVILESMASHIPIVATDIPGTRELIHHQENGWLAQPRDPLSLAQMIQTALENKQTSLTYADRASQTVKSFSIKSITIEYEKYFQGLINK